jgi:DNA-binding beta-propeller fold protein YncE
MSSSIKKLSLLIVGAIVFHASWSVMAQSESGPGAGVDAGQAVKTLVDQEKTTSTTAENVADRFKSFMRIAPRLMQAGVRVDSYLPRDQVDKIQSQIRDGKLDEAARKVHEVILWLGDQSIPSTPTGAVAAAPGGPPAPSASSQGIEQEIQQLVDAEKAAPTTVETLETRHRQMMGILFRLKSSGVDPQTILPMDEGRKLRDQVQSGSPEAVTKVHETILKLANVKIGASKASVTVSTASSKLVEDASPSAPLSHVNIHRLATGTSFGSLVKIMNPVVDSDNHRLYIAAVKSPYLAVVDTVSNKVVETVDVGHGGFLVPDWKNRKIYIFARHEEKWSVYDLNTKRAAAIEAPPPGIALPPREGTNNLRATAYKGDLYMDTGYPFSAGCMQDFNASYGLIRVTDASGKEVRQIKHGPDSLYFTIDTKTGRLYASNTGDGSISVFDLDHDAKKIADIDIGTSVDEIALDDKGGLFIRNRLGGSTVYYYNQKDGSLVTIPNENQVGGGIGMWPTQIIYDERYLYVLSHFAGRVDMIESPARKLIRSIPLGLSLKPRTDELSTMVMDRTRKWLYAAVPELSEIAVVGIGKNNVSAVIKLAAKKVEGPASVVLAVNEKLNRLFVYDYNPAGSQLLAFDDAKPTAAKSRALDIGRGDALLVSNPEKGLLYAGNKILDAVTLEDKGSFDRGMRVIAFDNAKGKTYLADMLKTVSSKNVERVYEYTGAQLTRTWVLSPVFSIPSSFAFDFPNRKFYVGYVEAAVVESFDLTEPGAIKAASSPEPANTIDDTRLD